MTQSTPATGSIRGTLSFLDPMDNFLEDAEEVVAEAIEDALHVARIEIREAALRDPEWKQFADILDVEYDNGEFHYVLNTDDEDRIQDALTLEYGDENRGPHSLIRKVARTQPGSMANQIAADVSAEVPIG